MLSEDDKKRIEAEEAYRAQVRGSGRRPSEVGSGFRLEFGSVLFRLVATAVLLLVMLVACSIIGSVPRVGY